MAPTRLPAGDERGMALGLALFALAIIGGMIAAGFLPAFLEQQGGRNLLIATQTEEAAEGVLWELISEADPAGLLGLAAGGPALDPGTVSAGSGLVVQRRITRLADNLFLVETRAAGESAGARELAARSMALLARLAADPLSGAQTLLPISRRAWLQLY